MASESIDNCAVSQANTRGSRVSLGVHVNQQGEFVFAGHIDGQRVAGSCRTGDNRLDQLLIDIRDFLIEYTSPKERAEFEANGNLKVGSLEPGEKVEVHAKGS